MEFVLGTKLDLLIHLTGIILMGMYIKNDYQNERSKLMSKTWAIIPLLFVFFTLDVQAVPDCIPRKELRDKHVVYYLAYNNTLRGCVVDPGFYTQRKKKGRGKLTRRLIIEICEGEPRTSPREGNSFEVCSPRSKPKKKTEEEPD